MKMTSKESDSSMKVGHYHIGPQRSLYIAANFCLFVEYKTWKKNSPFLYDMILGYVYGISKSHHPETDILIHSARLSHGQPLPSNGFQT